MDSLRYHQAINSDPNSMRDSFSAYYRPSADEIQQAWGKALFVLDTNILLNLYRYPITARTELLEVLASLQERIWIPFHVGVEFQRNRLTVIAGQKRRFSELKKELENIGGAMDTKITSLKLRKRHALIEVDPILEKMGELLRGFATLLDELKQKDDVGFDSDPIRDQLDKLFEGRVGKAPCEQFLKDIQREGDLRFKNEMPPGYADTGKDKGGGSHYMHEGLQYEKKLGDLIIWQQILQHAERENVEALIFLTDDEKEDWWEIVDADGRKKIGPRPELREEIKRVAKVSFFHMYNSESFLAHARDYLSRNVSQEVIDEVADVLHDNRIIDAVPRLLPLPTLESVIGGVERWIMKRGFAVQKFLEGFGAYVYLGDAPVELIVRQAVDVNSLWEMFREVTDPAFGKNANSESLLVIVGSSQEMHDAARLWFKSERAQLARGCSVVYGWSFIPVVLDTSSLGAGHFVPLLWQGQHAAKLMAAS